MDIVFPHPPHQCFTYEIPERLRPELKLGHRVLVRLGGRCLTGFAVTFNENPQITELREVEDLLDPYPLLTDELLKLTRWVADYYIAPWGEVIRSALPPGIHRREKLIVRYRNSDGASVSSIRQTDAELLSIIRNANSVTLRSIERKLKSTNIRYALGRLERLGLIETEQVLAEAAVSHKAEKWVSLTSGVDSLEIASMRKRAPKQAAVLQALHECGGEARRSDLDVDFSVLNRLLKSNRVEIWEEEVLREPYEDVTADENSRKPLTAEQSKALFKISEHLKKKTFGTFLLHGVTASGKTRVYIETIRIVLERDETALVLIPEISLTPQAVQRYKGVFGDRVAVLHSRMSQGERYDSWRRIRAGKAAIALGPRSTIFAPLENLGIIIVDEEHESSYKQMDPSPRYHARDVAVVRGKINRCTVLLGSATPSLESYYNADNGKYTLCEMKHRIDRVPLPSVTLIDRADKAHGRKVEILSGFLKEKIRDRLNRGEQTILLQNRRGFASFLRCSSCGNIETCPHCDISLTYHQKGHRARCHYCGFQRPASEVCPNCGGVTLNYRGVGTQRVEEELVQCFPGIRPIRMDQDTTIRKGAHDRIVRTFEKREADVLLGTQMVAKGHDFPGVSLVGVISADTGLYFPDFRAGERTFQLLTQAAGRAGRRESPGEVVVQTLTPEHPLLRLAAAQDYVSYYRWEVEQRKELNYPPWGRLVLVRFKGMRQENTARAAERFADFFDRGAFYEILGPVPAPISKARDRYRYHIIFRTTKKADPTGARLRQIIRASMAQFREKCRFPEVRISVDIDPVDTM